MNIEKVWDMLDTPEMIEKLIPHLHTMREVADGQYEATMKIGIGPVRGEFTGEITVLEKSRPQTYKLGLKGTEPRDGCRGRAHNPYRD